MRSITTLPSGATVEYLKYAFTMLSTNGDLMQRRPEGVYMTYPCGTKRWISNDFFTDDYLKQL